MNYKAPSNIQGSILPLLLGTEHPNVVCQSQTGTGKTGAFTIAMLHRIDPEIDATQALCIAPTRELARQIVSYVNIIARFMPEITTEVAIPGTVNKRTGEKVTAHIVVGTPGTVMDCLRRGMIDSKKLKVLVMDEADSLMELQGLGEQAIRVKNLVPKGTQFLLFSATFGGQVLKYANVFAPNAYKLTLKRHELTMAGIHQIYMDCKDEEDKYRVLNSLYYTCTVASSIIFVKVGRPVWIGTCQLTLRSVVRLQTSLPNVWKPMVTRLGSCMLPWTRSSPATMSSTRSAGGSARYDLSTPRYGWH